MGRVTPNLTSLKRLQITYKTPYELLQATPTSLPTSEPATSQISYTVAAADLPTLNMGVESKIIVALMYAGGKNTDAATQTVYWRMLKNGSSVANGSANVSTNYFWTLNAFFYNVAVGDTLELRLWASSTNVNWDYEARQLQFSRIALLEKLTLPLCNFVALAAQPVLSAGNPYASSTYNLNVYHASDIGVSINSAIDFSPWKQHATYKLFRTNLGDAGIANSAYVYTNSTYRPYYIRNYVPTEIRLRGLKTLT